MEFSAQAGFIEMAFTTTNAVADFMDELQRFNETQTEFNEISVKLIRAMQPSWETEVAVYCGLICALAAIFYWQNEINAALRTIAVALSTIAVALVLSAAVLIGLGAALLVSLFKIAFPALVQVLLTILVVRMVDDSKRVCGA